MPSAVAVRGKKPKEAAIVDLTRDPIQNPVAAAEVVKPEPANVPLFNPFDDNIPFFDALAMITPAEWEKYLIYIYRLDPKVRNPEGERAYIDKIQRTFDEGDIKATHGGGKYMAILKDDFLMAAAPGGPAPRERRWHFRIAGEPRLQNGQTLLSANGAAPAPGTPDAIEVAPRAPSSDVAVLASVLKELIENRQNGDTGSSQAIELAGQAYKTGLSIVSEAARQTVTTTTGSAIGDKLLERLFDSKFGGRNGDSDLRDKLAMIAIERLQNPPVAEAKDPLAQLGFVKDLLGVESIGDLIRPSAAGDTWKAKLVDLGVTLVGNLPQLFQLLLASQAQQFQRQIQLETLRRQGPVPVGVNPNTPPASPRIQIETAAHPPAPGPTPVPAPGEVPVSTLFNPAQMALDEIVVDYGEGLDGQMTARLVRQRYPIVMEQMKPMLGDLAQVKLFAQNTAPLNEIAGDEEFPQFLKEFVNEILHPATDDQEEQPSSTQPKEGA
jgi:hypothetical protein